MRHPVRQNDGHRQTCLGVATNEKRAGAGKSENFFQIL